MKIGSHDKLTPLFLLLIAVTFLLKSLGVFNAEFVGIIWPVLLGIIALIEMGGSS